MLLLDKGLPSFTAVEDTSVQNNYYEFLKTAFNVVNPHATFVPNWHIELLCRYLEAVDKGLIKRLIINMPPRHLKSITISSAWPAWILGRKPHSKLIVSSYSQALSDTLSLDTKAIMQTEWYRTLFPHTRIIRGENKRNKFVTSRRGMRFATSVGATLTGEGGDVLIIDDPHTPAQANSAKYRKRVMDWFDQTLSTRLNNPQEGKIVLVMQRLNQNDLTGHLLAKKQNWYQLCIPALNGKQEDLDIGLFTNRRTLRAPLNHRLVPAQALQRLQTDVGSYAFAAQYLQQPLSDSNSLIKKEWLQHYDKVPVFTRIVQSWDCAFKTGANSDYSVCTTWGLHSGKAYLIDVLKAKLEFPDLKQSVQHMYIQYKPSTILIEDKASGQVLIQELMKQYAIPIIKIRPTLDKTSRFLHSIGMLEAGNVVLPNNATWLASMLDELLQFPNTSHDDQVDSITQFLNWLQTDQQNSLRLRSF